MRLTTHSFECLTCIKQALDAHVADANRTIRLEDIHYTVRGIRSYFTDPFDGRRYSLTVEPVMDPVRPFVPPPIEEVRT